MTPRWSLTAASGLVAVAAIVGGCNKKQAEVAPAAAPAIPISHPVTREVTDYIDFTGRTEAKDSVSIVPRVTGYLMSMPFKEGAEVKAGDVLFEIDPRPYQAQYDQAYGQVLLNEAREGSDWPTTCGPRNLRRRRVRSAIRISIVIRRRKKSRSPRSRRPRRAWKSTS